MKYKNYWHLMINLRFVFLFVLFVTNASLSNEKVDIGKVIYHQGLDNHKVNMGDGFNVSAGYFPCTNCHGRTGQGLQEGGIYAPNITWHQLTKPYQLKSTQGRQRQAYELGDFERLLTTGVDVSGNHLSEVMPRYNYNSEQIAALWQTLKHLSTQSISGIDDDRITIGLALGDVPYRQTVIKIIKSYFNEINGLGGVFQRTLELVNDGSLTFGNGCCVAILAFDMKKFPDWASSLTRIAVFSSADSEAENPVFSLYPAEQQRQQILQHYFQRQEIEKLKQDSVQKWLIKAPGAESVSLRGQAHFLKLIEDAQIDIQWVDEQLRILSSARLLVQVLNVIGRDVNPKAINNAIIQTHDFHTHFGPALSFGPQRFIGAYGGMIKAKTDQKWLWYELQQ